MAPKPPDAIFRIATIGPLILMPILFLVMGRSKSLVVLLGMAVVAGILAAYWSRDEDDTFGVNVDFNSSDHARHIPSDST